MTKPQEQLPLCCEVCLQEIPLSETHSDEATDYVVHFCGLACYEQWQQQQTDNLTPGCPPQTRRVPAK